MVSGLPVKQYYSKLVGVCGFEDALPLIQCRAQSRLPQDPKSIITMLFPYYTGAYPARNVSRYALPDDYHGIAAGSLNALVEILRKAHPNHEFAAFVDVSPIREVRAAALAGLGVIGRNGLLINERYGSFVFIGEIVTSLNLPHRPRKPAACMECGKCEAACPTGAITRGAGVNPELCLSRITQKKGGLPEHERELLHRHKLVWGCDICQDVCPHNKNPRITPIEAFTADILPVLTRENLDAALLRKPYAWRGKNVLLRNFEILNI
jgi:epoxyqueuosine reductase QueG